jgi:aspartate racemase
VTAHYFHEGLKKRLNVPVLHLIEETVRWVQKNLKGVRRLGLLATTGTIQSRLFQSAFSPTGIELIVPTPETQENMVMKAIYGDTGIKAIGPSERSRRLVLQAARKLIARGAQGVIAGCTEIPLVLQDGDLSVPVIDSIAILARAALRKARGRKASP